MKKSTAFLTFAAIVLALAANLSLAWGYFTTYTQASGRIPLGMEDTKTDIEEEVKEWTKHVVITSEEDSQPVFVRARAFGGEQYDLVYSDPTGSWSQGTDGFWYLNRPLLGGEKTPELLVKINGVPDKPQEEADKEFNVVVVYETTPVLYDASGNPYANWEMTLHATEGGDS